MKPLVIILILVVVGFLVLILIPLIGGFLAVPNEAHGLAREDMKNFATDNTESTEENLRDSMLFQKRSAKLPEILRPFHLVVDGNRLYIAEKSAIYLYSTEDFKFIKKFGKLGEGPGEWKLFTKLSVFPRYVVVNALDRLVFFTREGEFIKNIKIPLNPVHYVYAYPIGNNFVGFGNDYRSNIHYSTILLFNTDMKVIKEMARQKSKSRWTADKKYHAVGPPTFFNVMVYGENIYLANSEKGFFIEVFDAMGNKLHEINKDYEKIKVTAEYKKDFIKTVSYKEDPGLYQYSFDEYFPAFKRVSINSGKIYVCTYKILNKKRELIVMDLKGKVLKNSSVKIDTMSYIYNDRIYYLEENEEEDWIIYEEAIN